MDPTTPVNVLEYEALAHPRMAAPAWGYYAGGSDDEVTMRACRAAFERIRLRPRVLVDVSHVELATTILGTPISMPILIAPTPPEDLAAMRGQEDQVLTAMGWTIDPTTHRPVVPASLAAVVASRKSSSPPSTMQASIGSVEARHAH